MNTSVNDIPTLCKMAGYFDGEGCVLVAFDSRRILYPSWRLQLNTGDIRNLQLFSTFSSKSLRLGTKVNRQMYVFCIGGQKFLELAQALEPHLLAKQAQVSYAIESYLEYRQLIAAKEKEQAFALAAFAQETLKQMKRD